MPTQLFFIHVYEGKEEVRGIELDKIEVNDTKQSIQEKV